MFLSFVKIVTTTNEIRKILVKTVTFYLALKKFEENIKIDYIIISNDFLRKPIILFVYLFIYKVSDFFGNVKCF